MTDHKPFETWLEIFLQWGQAIVIVYNIVSIKKKKKKREDIHYTASLEHDKAGFLKFSREIQTPQV